MPPSASRRSRRRLPGSTAESPSARPVPRPSGHRTSPWERWFPLVIVAVGLVAYHGSFTTPFLFDDVTIANTRALRELWSWAPLTGTTRPLVQLTLALNYAWGGLDVVGYHVVNFAIHAAAGLALYGIVVRTLRLPTIPAPWRDEAAGLALATSLVWVVHPLQTESVTYVVQRAESLMALCYLLTLYAVIRGVTAGARAGAWYVAAVAACALGMLCKPVMVTAPIAVLLYDRVFLAGSWRERLPLHAGLAATLLVAIAILAGPHESAASAGFAMKDVSWSEFSRSQPGVVLHYLRLVLWPHPLVLDYGWPVAHDVVAIGLPLLVIVGLMAATVWLWRRSPMLGLPAVLFFLVLAPSSSLVPIRDLAFEHRMYLPLAPLVALLVVAARAATARLPGTLSQLPLALLVGVVVVLTARTIARNRDYASAIGMWTDVVAHRPTNARARVSLGSALMSEARNDEALPLFVEAVRLDPSSAEAENNWGVVLVDQGKPAEAEPHYRAALRLQPAYAEAENNLGVALMGQGQPAEAQAHYARALELAPDYAEAASNLGNVLARLGKPAEAVPYYRRALQLAPEVAEVHFNLALALAALGETAEARQHAAEAVRQKPALQTVVQGTGLL